MANDLFAILGRANLVLTLSALVACALRTPLRRWFGAQRAYAIWLIVPLALVGGFMPAPRGSGPERLLETVDGAVQAYLTQIPSALDVVLFIWVAGVCVSLVIATRRHARFRAEVEAGQAGPAIIGVVRPRLVTPADFRARFSSHEQVLIRAHERVHIERYDARWNALAVLVQALLWFNPLIHLAVRAMKLDQEVACDAAVIDLFPQDRLTYAKALISAQPPAATSPLGCHWASGRVHPLVARLGVIADRSETVQRNGLWVAMSLTLWSGALVTAWAAQPPDRTVDRHAVQYAHYAGRLAGATIAAWTIAVNPD